MQPRSLLTTALGAALLFGIGGCQFDYLFELSGTVRDPLGKPLSGVRVGLMGANAVESSFPTVTGPDGNFKGKIKVHDIEFTSQQLPRWFLQLSRDGYESSSIDVSHKERAGGTMTCITANGWLKPLANGPGLEGSQGQNNQAGAPLQIDCGLKIERRQADLWAIITFTNRMKKRVPLWKRTLFMEDRITFDAFDVTRDGSGVPYHGILAKRLPPGDQDLYWLQPGQSYTARVRLNDYYAVSIPGHYSVTYLMFDGYASGYRLMELRSNTASFEVK